MNNAVLNMKIPSELMERVKIEANRKHISAAALIRMILSEYFEMVDKEDGKML